MNKLSSIIIIIILLLLLNFLLIKREKFSIDIKIIPKVIYLSYKTKDIPSYILENWKKLNPDYEIKLYDNDDCKKFFLENYTQMHVDLFNFLEDGPIKADFWRVCILNTYGGVYSDIDIELLVPVDTIIEEGVTFLTCKGLIGINPHLIMTVKNHPLIKKCVDTYVEKYKSGEKYDYWKYSITGILYNHYVTMVDDIKEGISFDKFNNKYQLISEKVDVDYTNINDILDDVYCSYKNTKVLNNRYKKYNSTTHSFEHFDIDSKTIPKVIYLSYKTKDIPSYILENWTRLNPGYEVKLYDNDDCKKFLTENYTQKHVNVFDFLEDGPIKADYWRVCILNTYGGVYSDIDVELLVPIDDIIEKDVIFLTCGSFLNTMNPHFIMSIKNHPILSDCINTYISMYDNKIPYGYWQYSITTIMQENIVKYINFNPKIEGILYDNQENKYQILSEIDPGNYQDIYCSYKSKKVLNNRYKKYNHNSHSFENFMNYSFEHYLNKYSYDRYVNYKKLN
jgi:mannosyltransferase OCH1-like enzyme